MSEFTRLERVRFGDLDAMQHLNNVEFLRFFETARIAYLEELIPDFSPTERGAFGYVVGENHIAYRAPAGFGDEIRTTVRPRDPEGSTWRFDLEMHRESDGTLLAEGFTVLVGFDYDTEESAEIPDSVQKLLG